MLLLVEPELLGHELFHAELVILVVTGRPSE